MKISEDALGRYAEKIRKRAKNYHTAFRYLKMLYKKKKMRMKEYKKFCKFIWLILENLTEDRKILR